MGWRFRKRISFGKFIKLNLSKSGVSTTFGVKGFSYNVGKKGVYRNLGIPGTGLYSRERVGNKIVEQNYDFATSVYHDLEHLCFTDYDYFQSQADYYQQNRTDVYEKSVKPLIVRYSSHVIVCPKCNKRIVPYLQSLNNTGLILIGTAIMIVSLLFACKSQGYSLIGFIAGLIIALLKTHQIICLNCKYVFPKIK